MEEDFLTKLPSEIIIDILLRLPVRTIGSCKCVCKALLTLVGTFEFAESYLPKSIPGLAVLRTKLIGREVLNVLRTKLIVHEVLKNFTVYKVNDVPDLEELNFHQLIEFNLPFYGWIHGSVNGLLFLNSAKFYDGLYVCNPFTREYIKLHYPRELSPPYRYFSSGFGASRVTNQYKVVGIFHDCKHGSEQRELGGVPKVECQVYTLGTGSWRRIEPEPPCKYGGWGIGVFANGNLHWLVYDLDGSLVISCFDLETELFSTFSVPPLPRWREYHLKFSVLDGCLCLSDDLSDSIWVMKEYGDEKSWTKEHVIRISRHFGKFSSQLHFIEVFKDGYHSNKTNTRREIDSFSQHHAGAKDSICLTLSFLSLKNFPMENVGSL